MTFPKVLVTMLFGLSVAACGDKSADVSEAATTEPAATEQAEAPATGDSKYAAAAEAEITDENADAKADALLAEIEADLGTLEE